MTFQRSLSLSLGIHVLIFGSAIAVAGYARGALGGHGNVITVALVDSGPRPSGKILQGTGQHEVRSVTRPAMINKTTSRASRQEMPTHDRSTQAATSLPADQESQTTGAGGNTASGHLQGETGRATGFGLISADQWAVIESAIERSKNYPRLARERGIQGVVRVRFKLRPTGEVETVEIVKSSGYDVLDTASVKTVYRAAPLPYVNGWVEVPMAYILK